MGRGEATEGGGAAVSTNGEAAKSWTTSGLAVRSVAGLGLLLVAVIALGSVAGEMITPWAAVLIDALGPAGVALGVLASDALGVPVPPTTYVFVAVASGGPVLLLLCTAIFFSLLGASLAFCLGPHLGRLKIVRIRLERFESVGSPLFQKWGVWTVAVAAMTPVPFSVSCWLAGAYKMRYPPFLAATCFRIPQILGYYALFVFGWASAG